MMCIFLSRIVPTHCKDNAFVKKECAFFCKTAHIGARKRHKDRDPGGRLFHRRFLRLFSSALALASPWLAAAPSHFAASA